MPLGFLTHPHEMLAADVKGWGKAAGPVGVKNMAIEFYFSLSELATDSPCSPQARKMKRIWWCLHSSLAALGVERASLCCWVVPLQGAQESPEEDLRGAGLQVAQECALYIKQCFSVLFAVVVSGYVLFATASGQLAERVSLPS